MTWCRWDTSKLNMVITLVSLSLDTRVCCKFLSSPSFSFSLRYGSVIRCSIYLFFIFSALRIFWSIRTSEYRIELFELSCSREVIIKADLTTCSSLWEILCRKMTIPMGLFAVLRLEHFCLSFCTLTLNVWHFWGGFVKFIHSVTSVQISMQRVSYLSGSYFFGQR